MDKENSVLTQRRTVCNDKDDLEAVTLSQLTHCHQGPGGGRSQTEQPPKGPELHSDSIYDGCHAGFGMATTPEPGSLQEGDMGSVGWEADRHNQRPKPQHRQ